jgi:hypothetical protein
MIHLQFSCSLQFRFQCQPTNLMLSSTFHSHPCDITRVMLACTNSSGPCLLWESSNQIQPIDHSQWWSEVQARGTQRWLKGKSICGSATKPLSKSTSSKHILDKKYSHLDLHSGPCCIKDNHHSLLIHGRYKKCTTFQPYLQKPTSYERPYFLLRWKIAETETQMWGVYKIMQNSLTTQNFVSLRYTYSKPTSGQHRNFLCSNKRNLQSTTT